MCPFLPRDERGESNNRSQQEFNPLLAAPASVALPPPPFPPRSLLVSGTADRIPEHAAQLALAWGPADNQPPWTDLLEAVMRVTFDHRDGTAGNLLVNSDRVLRRSRRFVKYGVARVGRA